eukprot:TRINITY_DN1544_c0_g2_i1.p1 TRINITY_DN1544_c0_g2~~TRINITY_DN1544_c0_g2_i1.p1  ORF type:complete len:358 (+),score=27.48 TRINITY_DN1544_c0_g2_i1:140-1075(+)
MDSSEDISVYRSIDDQPISSEISKCVEATQSIAGGKIKSIAHGESPHRSTGSDIGSARVGPSHQNCNARIGGREDSAHRWVSTKTMTASVPLDREESRCDYRSLDDFIHGSFSSSLPADFKQMDQVQQWQWEENVVSRGCFGQRHGNVRQQRRERAVGDHGDVHYSHLPNRPAVGVSQVPAVNCESQRGVFAALRRWSQKRATIAGIPVYHRDPNEPSTFPYGHLDDGSALPPSRLSGRENGAIGTDRSDVRSTIQKGNRSRSSDYSQAMSYSRMEDVEMSTKDSDKPSYLHIDWALGVHDGDDVHALPSV